MHCPKCASNVPEGRPVCPNCGAALDPGLPMKWYRFLITAGLWIAGIGTIILGIATMLGVPYMLQGLIPGAIYDAFHPLVFLDSAYGLILIVLGVMFILTRFRLTAWRTNGPRTLYCTYALVIVSSLIYSAVCSWVIGTPASQLVGLNELSSIAGMIAGITLNVIYFNKRKHLFYE